MQEGVVQIQERARAKKLETYPDLKTVDTTPVRVTLHDCLACSGCITSAETVMLEQQSVDEFMKQVSSEDKAVIVSISPQSRASLACYYGITPLQALKKLTTFFKSLGVKAVFDTSCSRDMSLIESCEEFIKMYKAQGKTNCFPLLASSCPGWVCYAEKTLDPYILPHISSVKSPQQTMGAIIKRFASFNMGLRVDQIHHVTVMPCYDKKLEASRDDFLFSIEEGNEEAGAGKFTEVDCVLTSGEMLELLQAKCSDFTLLDESPIDRMLTNVDETGHLYGSRGGSGGYAECIFRHAARELFNKELPSHLEFRTLRNSDFKELTLEVEGEVVLRFACCYGFRNIQNLVRKVKSGKCQYQFVEIMACPSGCLNGGGQIKPKKGQSGKDLIQSLETAYLNEVDVSDPFENPIIKGLYDFWLGYPGSEKSIQIMHTGYHTRERSVTAQLSNW
ncbi:hypothetical protein GOP47_0007562 [Adiantum capillus-veneris]|uniref:Iron hydrogenase small subunit domain-containing protein n=1 Tax=Adiantum capillus-veneris TaxID=13818 RepID=A0A9D4ZJC3_ADICA|nr:hypothetical protein GOP47_0007562 [Adiantum capillus-veneris]